VNSRWRLGAGGATRLGAVPHPLARWPAWWRLPVEDRRWIAGAALASGLILLAGGAAWWWQSTARVAARQSLAEAQREQAAAQQRIADAARAAAAASAPWWTLLPTSPAGERSPVEQLSADALMLAPKLGVQLQRLSFSPLPATDGAPYRSTTVQAELRGPYPDVKRWLGELLARRPHSVAVKSVDLRRAAEDAGPTGAVEASIELRLFERMQVQQ